MGRRWEREREKIKKCVCVSFLLSLLLFDVYSSVLTLSLLCVVVGGERRGESFSMKRERERERERERKGGEREDRENNAKK